MAGTWTPNCGPNVGPLSMKRPLSDPRTSLRSTPWPCRSASAAAPPGASSPSAPAAWCAECGRSRNPCHSHMPQTRSISKALLCGVMGRATENGKPTKVRGEAPPPPAAQQKDNAKSSSETIKAASNACPHAKSAWQHHFAQCRRLPCLEQAATTARRIGSARAGTGLETHPSRPNSQEC